MSDRRSFLRGLAALPMIGGSVALIGRPTAAAVTVTDDLLSTYETWLDHERSWLLWQRWGTTARFYKEGAPLKVVWCEKATGRVFDFHQVSRGNERFDHSDAASRAAIVLSAVGCPLSGGYFDG